MTTIGQNSPATADPRVFCPSGDRRTPASERIGTSVPSAVVAIATAINHPEAPTPAASSPKPRTAPMDIEIPQPIEPRVSSWRETLLWIDLDPRQEEEHHEPEGGQELDVRVGLRDVENLWADEDPQQDLDDDDRQMIRGVTRRVIGARRRGAEDQGDREEIRLRRHRRPRTGRQQRVQRTLTLVYSPG